MPRRPFAIFFAITLLLSVAVSVPGVLAGEPEGPEDGPLTLEDAVALAVENSADLKLYRLAVDRAKLNLETAGRAADRISEDEVSNYEMRQAKEVTPREAEKAYNVARISFEQERVALRMAVQRAFYGVLRAEDLVGVSEQAVEQARAQLRAARSRYEAEIVPYADVLAAEVGLADAEAGLLSTRRSLEAARMEFNRVTGRPLDAVVQLEAGEDAPLDDALPEVEVLLVTSMEKRADVVAAREEMEVQQLRFGIASSYYTPNVYAYRLAELDFEEAKAKLEKVMTSVEMEVRSTRLDLLDARQRVAVREKALEQARENLRITELRYNAGLITSPEVLGAQASLAKAEADYISARFDYELARSQLETVTGQWGES